MEDVKNIELEVAYCSEKILNIDILMMNIVNELPDYDAIPLDMIEKAFEFDLLVGILDSELGELNDFMRYLRVEIVDAHRHLKSSQTEEKLIRVEESLNQSQDQFADIMTHFAKLERVLTLRNIESDMGHVSLIDKKWKMNTVEQQRDVLQMLEKSLARELDLEEKLLNVRNEEDMMSLKLGFLENKASSTLEKFFEADSISVVMMETSKRLISKLQEAQFSLSSSFQRENETRSKLEKLLEVSKLEANSLRASLKESQERFSLSTMALKGQVNSLEQRLRESETSGKLLARTNVELSKEIDLIKNAGFEKELERTKVEFAAITEKRDLLRCASNDMGILIHDLKNRVLEANTKAQRAESNCSLLSGTNSRLDDEISNLRRRLGFLEGSLQQAEQAKKAAAKDISVNAKSIHDLAMKLSTERERLQVQVSRLTKDNEAVGEEGIQEHEKESIFSNSFKGSVMESSTTNIQVESSRVADQLATPASMVTRKNETIRSIEAQVLGPKHILIAALVLAISAFSIYVLQLENCPF